MRTRIFAAILLGSALAACERESQQLPFSVDNPEPTVQTVTAGASATVSTPAGAAVQFPTGSVTGSTSVSLAPTAPPAATQKSGTPVSTSYQLTPAGLQLEKPALAELKFSPGSDASRAWLASMINVTPNGVREIGNTRLDLRSGFAESRIDRLGTLTVVIPEPAAVVRAQRSGARRSMAAASISLLASGTDSLVTRCGDPDNRCSGLTVTASDNLLNKVENAAAIYPLITGVLRINGSQASGEVNLTTTLRVLLQSNATAENVDFQALLRPTASTVVSENASQITMTNVFFRVSGSSGSESGVQEHVGTLTIPKGGTGGSITISREFQMRNDADQLENASVTLTFPVQFYQ